MRRRSSDGTQSTQDRSPADPAPRRAAADAGRGGRARPAGARAAAQADRPERDPRRRRGRQRRVHPLPVHRRRQAGLAFLWAAFVGVAIQFFINMEIERYTLATGQTAITGFQRLWKPWGLILVLMALLATAWPGWATSAATIATFLFGGGDPTVIAIAMLFAIGVTLTALAGRLPDRRAARVPQGRRAARVHRDRAVRRDQRARPTATRSQAVTSFGDVPGRDRARDPRRRAGGGRRGRREQPRAEQLDPRQGLRHGRATRRASSRRSPARRRRRRRASATASPTTRQNLRALARCGGSGRTSSSSSPSRVIAALSITVFSLIAYSTVFGNPDLPEESGFDFISLEADVLDARVGDWFGTLFLAIGAVSLFAAALGIVDYVSRLVADVVRVGYTQRQRAAGPRAGSTSRSSGRWSSSAPRSCCARLRPAARPGDDLDRARRRDHVHLLVPARGHQPALPARRSSSSAATGSAIIGVAIVLLGVTLDDRRHRPVRQPVLMRGGRSRRSA